MEYSRFWQTREESRLRSAIANLERSMELGCVHAAFDLGCLYFEGRFVRRGVERSYGYLLKAAKSGDEEALCWIRYFLDDDEEPVIGEEAEEPHRIIRAHGFSKREFNFPDRGLANCPEWQILMYVCDLDGHGCCCSKDLWNKRGGFSNGTFQVNPYYWGESGDDGYLTDSEIPNFIFLPTGFEIEWYKYPFRDSYMNRCLDEKQIRHIWRLCIESVIEQYARRWEE